MTLHIAKDEGSEWNTHKTHPLMGAPIRLIQTTGTDSAVMCNLTNTNARAHTHTHTQTRPPLEKR